MKESDEFAAADTDPVKFRALLDDTLSQFSVVTLERPVLTRN